MSSPNKKTSNESEATLRKIAMQPEEVCALLYGDAELFVEARDGRLGMAPIEGRQKARARRKGGAPTPRSPQQSVAAPPSADGMAKTSRSDESTPLRGLKGRGVVGFAAMRKHVANNLAKKRAARSEARAKGGDQMR